MSCLFRNSPLFLCTSLLVLVGSAMSYNYSPALPALGVMCASLTFTVVFLFATCFRIQNTRRAQVDRVIEKTESERESDAEGLQGVMIA